MKKQEFKQSLFQLFDADIDSMAYEEKGQYIEKLVYDYQRDRDSLRQKPNNRKP